MQKFLDVLQAALMVIGALAALCGVLANVLPDGKLKTAVSFIGMRLVMAQKIVSGAIPTTPSGVPVQPKKEGAS